MIKPLSFSEYDITMCRFINDLSGSFDKTDDIRLTKADTIRKHLKEYLYNGDFNILLHIHYTLHTDIPIISKAIEHIGLYASKALFDTCKCTELQISKNEYIISITLFNIICLLTVNTIRGDDKLFNELATFLINYVPKELYSMIDIGKTNKGFSLKDPTNGTFQTNDDVFFVDDIEKIEKEIVNIKSKFPNMNSRTALSKVIRMTTRVKLTNPYAKFIYIAGTSLNSLNMSIGTDGENNYVFMTMNLSDYAKMFTEWKSFMHNANPTIPFMYYCLLHDHEIFDIVKIKDKTVEDDLITCLQHK